MVRFFFATFVGGFLCPHSILRGSFLHEAGSFFLLCVLHLPFFNAAYSASFLAKFPGPVPNFSTFF